VFTYMIFAFWWCSMVLQMLLKPWLISLKRSLDREPQKRNYNNAFRWRINLEKSHFSWKKSINSAFNNRCSLLKYSMLMVIVAKITYQPRMTSRYYALSILDLTLRPFSGVYALGDLIQRLSLINRWNQLRRCSRIN